ncbi:hypothetical protein G7Z17_g3175 [Cylindrodendrum hubeiense]|uniref:BZIP domain-containing protein n=1 Tax=Cylindrodendrum hubeiense TaxID=595255 RepID=A0A9P5LK94_9HYPO|nr:hypothetical protein G7Z17_g3175 [Cylindrodendrum hubeiense]
MDQDAASGVFGKDPSLPDPQPSANPDTQSKTGDEIADEAEKRRERKRFTDRVAQRQHRKRQKLYIEELEDQLRVLRSGGQSEVAQLTAHNARLYDEVMNIRTQVWPTSTGSDADEPKLKRFHGLWDEMEDLLRRQRLLRQHSALRASWDTQSPHPDPHSPDLVGGLATWNTRSELGPNALDCTETRPADLATPTQAEPVPMDITPASEEMDETATVGDPVPASFDNTIASHIDGSEATSSDDTSAARVQLQQSLPNAAGCSRGGSQLVRDTDTLRDQIREANGHSVSDDGTAVDWIHIYQQLDNGMSSLPSQGVHTSHQNPAHPHGAQSTSNAMLAPLSQCRDAIIELGNFLDVDAWSSQSNNLPNQASSLNTERLTSTLLSAEAGPRQSGNAAPRCDTISTAPVHSIESILDLLGTCMGQWIPPPSPMSMAMPLMEFLAAYWVMYLLLRWQVIRDESAYESVPSWLRPTQLQLTVPHPLAADLVPWPEIREELIHMSLTDETGPYDVSRDIIRHMTVDIHNLEQTGLQDLHRLEAAILDLKNWRLSEEFFDRYPQWKCLKTRDRNFQPLLKATETLVF